MRTGIFGGSFNPIHNGHIMLARQLLACAELDEIWFVVSPQNPLKRQADLLDDATRLRMVSLALRGEPGLVASDYEFRMPRPSFTWHTLRSMASDFPGWEFVLLIGADNWACFDRWFAWREILAGYRIVVYPRPGTPVDEASMPPGVSLAHTSLTDVSSTEVRRRIRAGEPFEGMVPPCVSEFIRSRKLYL